jgi:hypothetical protein
VSALSTCSKNSNFFMIFYMKVDRSNFLRGASQKGRIAHLCTPPRPPPTMSTLASQIVPGKPSPPRQVCIVAVSSSHCVFLQKEWLFLIDLTRFAWWWQDLHAIELLRAHIGEWTITRMLDYWRVMCFTDYRLNWNSWIWIPFPVDSECTLLCAQVDRTRYSSIASGNNCIVQLCKCVSLHL